MALEENKYLGKIGFPQLIEEIKTRFSKTGHTHTKSEITDLNEDLNLNIDDTLSLDSENPVQNKVIANAIKEINDKMAYIDKEDNENIEDTEGSGSTSSACVQSDWNQNDETASDYVKNRTHWIEEQTVEILPETTITFTNGQGSLSFVIDLEHDKNYTVTFNGVKYQGVAKAIVYNGLDVVGIGNAGLFGIDDMSTDDPFVLGIIPSNGVTMFANSIGATEATFKIVRNDTIYHKLNKNFLPDGIGTQSDWSQDDETAPDHVKNRTHYDTRVIETSTVEEPITFDGSLDDKEYVAAPDNSVYFVKVSDKIFTKDEFIGVEVTMSALDGSGETYTDTITEDIIGEDTENGLIMAGECIVSVLNSQVTLEGITITKGTHYMYLPNQLYVSSSTLTQTVTKTVVKSGELKTLDKKYMPENMAMAWTEIGEEVILPEIEITFTDNVGYIFDVLDIAEGDTCRVTWNGTEYITTAKPLNYNGMDILGVGNFAVIGGEDTGEPFALGILTAEQAAQNNGVGVQATALDGSTSAELFISVDRETIHKFDNKFMEFIEETDEILDAITWDGDTTGLETVEGFYKVSDMILTATDFANGGVISYLDDGVENAFEFTAENIFTDGDMCMIWQNEATILCLGSNIASQIGASTGIYFNIEVRSISIPGGFATGKTSSKIKSEYLPEINIPDPLPAVTSENNGAFLRVVDGVWSVSTLANAEDGEF